MQHSAGELVESLPDSLQERARVVQAGPLRHDAEFVLYWMRTAVRADENPALDLAIQAANKLEVPLLVYHALSERYPFASDRHHTFIIQGARDVQVSIQRRRVGYVFHLERHGQRGPHLRTLAMRAAFVVTEEMPVEPLRGWTLALGRVGTPIIAVDTACVVPMQLVGKAHERAFAFRNATRKLYAERLHRLPDALKPIIESYVPQDLPFDPIDLQAADIPQLVSECDIDHAIGPVPHTVGGSSAGYARWEAFKRGGLSRYDRSRNNPLNDGVSRMSPYLHYGMVSPLRIAREAAEFENEGAEKFLDELLIWRELAYAFCFYRHDHERLSALPDWALATLSEHETDERPRLLSWETMARGRTGDLLWDAAQRSLLLHGELHNNVRMTWGKTILNWTRDAERALATMIDLNHRYALDGRDPASYGGILWCLGQFDRPFPPARPIFGTVRNRTTNEHAQRLDPHAYLQRTTRHLNNPMPTVAVIGAGVSGLMCARTLADHGFPVTVFEKSRGVGGRMATRRVEKGLRFDHGAQYFTVRDGRFKRYVDSWVEDGIVQRWEGRLVVLEGGVIKAEKGETDRYVAVPAMNAICKHLAKNMNVKFHTRVAPLRRVQDRWQLSSDDDSELGLFDVAIVSVPARQTAELMQLLPAAELADRARGVEMHGCWAVMLAVPGTLDLGFDGAFVHDSPLAWIARNNSKPGRSSSSPETWVLHASAEWSREHIEESPAAVESMLLEEFWQAVGTSPSQLQFRAAHRWRFALPPEPLVENCLFDCGMQIGACGDWCAGPRVEGAFLSGMAAAGRVMGLLKKTESSQDKRPGRQLDLFELQ